MPIPGVKTHAPSGAAPWPLVLLEGDEGAGKSYALAQFSRSDRIGEMFWIPLGEGGVAEQYGAIPGARYEVVELDSGDYLEVIAVVRKIKEYALARKEAGETLPVVLAIDSVSGVWEGLKNWVTDRARESKRGKAILRDDPHAEIKPPRNLWNAANTRWHTLQAELKTFPGIVVVTARGKDVSATDPNTGQPLVGTNGMPVKEWSSEINRELPYAVDVRVRLRRESGAEVVFVRSVAHGRKPSENREPQPVDVKEADDRLLEWLLFDALGVDPSTAFVAESREFGASELTEEEKAPEEGEPDQSRPARRAPAQRGRTEAQWLAAVGACVDLEGTRALWSEAQRAGLLTADVDGIDLGDRIRARAEDIKAGRATAPGEDSADPVGPPSAPLPAAEPPADLPGPGGAQEAPSGDQETEDAPATGAPGRSPVPDNPREVQLTAARRGVLSTLTSLGLDEDDVFARFGRVAEQVATRWLSVMVREAITEGRRVSEDPADIPPVGNDLGETDGGSAEVDGEPVVWSPDADVKPGKMRAAALAALTEMYGSEEAAAAVVEQEYGKPVDLVGNRRLVQLLNPKQAEGATL
jgi:hypothetical protein